MKTIQSLSAVRREDHSFVVMLDILFLMEFLSLRLDLMYRQFICCKCSWLIAPTGSWVVPTGLCPSIILHYLQLSAPPSLLPSHSSDRSFPKLSLWSSYALVLGSVRYERLSIYTGTAPVMNARGRGSEEHKAQFFSIFLPLPRYITALQGKRRSGMISTVACHSIYFLFLSPRMQCFIVWGVFWGGGGVGENMAKKISGRQCCALPCI